MIDSIEVEIVGAWRAVDGRVEADAASQRIERLIHQYLKFLGRGPSGWDQLHVDPCDGRLWELTYPQSDLHGGGPPTLKVLSEQDARAKFGLTAAKTDP